MVPHVPRLVRHGCQLSLTPVFARVRAPADAFLRADRSCCTQSPRIPAVRLSRGEVAAVSNLCAASPHQFWTMLRCSFAFTMTQAAGLSAQVRCGLWMDWTQPGPDLSLA
jgi:hypothetical protein